jgi:hypothetical protein
MTFSEARAYIRCRRNPPHDDAGDDLEFVRLWRRRHGYFTGISFGIAVIGALSRYWPGFIFFGVAAIWSFVLYRRFGAIHTLFDEHASDLENEHEHTTA